MALLSPQTVTKAGIAPSYSTVNATDTVALAPGAVQFLHVKNGNAAACTVTIVDAGTTPAGSAATNPTVTVPANTGDRMIGPLKNSFADQTTGLISVTYSVQTTVTAALVSVPLS